MLRAFQTPSWLHSFNPWELQWRACSYGVGTPLSTAFFELIAALRPENKRAKGFLIFTGVLGVIADIIFFTTPGSAALAVSSIPGVLLLVWGGFTLGGGVWILRERREAKNMIINES